MIGVSATAMPAGQILSILYLYLGIACNLKRMWWGRIECQSGSSCSLLDRINMASSWTLSTQRVNRHSDFKSWLSRIVKAAFVSRWLLLFLYIFLLTEPQTNHTAGELSSPVLNPSSCLFSLWQYLHTFQILNSVKHDFLGSSFSSWAVFSGGSKWTIILQELRCHLAIGSPECMTNTSRNTPATKRKEKPRITSKRNQKRPMLHPMPMFASIFSFLFA